MGPCFRRDDTRVGAADLPHPLTSRRAKRALAETSVLSKSAAKRAGTLSRPFCEIQGVTLAVLDLGDLVGLGAAGGDDFDGCALLLADQRARQGRGDGDA